MSKILYQQDIGDVVVCDFCNEDYTGSPETGGLVFGSKAACPKCEDRIRELATKYNETHFIVAECPEDKSFWQFILDHRGGDNTVTVYVD